MDVLYYNTIDKIQYVIAFGHIVLTHCSITSDIQIYPSVHSSRSDNDSAYIHICVCELAPVRNNTPKAYIAVETKHIDDRAHR